ncbi:MAG: lamin tail domain-containing protein, partial [Gemmatimonadaceae bacterium]|nr:lamin tail domain-containing protein [Gemmatimonadaceae bacterium]
MRLSLRALPATLALLLISCRGDGPTAPAASLELSAAPSAAVTLPSIRISEIHYDNTGVDVGEAIEISGPAGASVAGWTLVLYNGTGGVTYTPLQTLTGTIPATCGDRGVVVLNYATNGIQNGAPDGMALVTNTGQVIEYLSYEGTFTATNGPAAGMLSTSIGVEENGTEAVGRSLQRRPDGTWAPSAANTFGACNDAGAPPAPVITSVRVEPSAAELTVGGSTTLVASAFDAANAAV